MCIFRNKFYEIIFVNDSNYLWEYRVLSSDSTFCFKGPSFEINNELYKPQLTEIKMNGDPQRLSNGCIQYSIEGVFKQDNNLSLEILIRIAENNPVFRFCYILKSKTEHRLTKSNGHDEMIYLETSLKSLNEFKEIRFSEFNEMVHSFCLSEIPVDKRFFENNMNIMGPMLSGSGNSISMLIAYENGSQVPDAYISYYLEDNYYVKLKANKGNYYNGQIFNLNNPFKTIWFQVAAVDGNEDMLAEAYRSFVLNFLSLNSESRKPYIYYNTWAYQERNKWLNGKTYLDSMNQERILNEIDVAHKMGIDVFVLDTGWYEKTGDWCASRQRFPDGLKSVKERLDKYNMKLGLWFDPLAAAVTSKMFKNHSNCVITLNNEHPEAIQVWETEESHRMCLVSDYADAFADELIRLVKEVGVTYFKWDAIWQYACNDPKHHHGNEENSEQERLDCYAFSLGTAMSSIIDKLCQTCPEAIVDFDITEGQRNVGLGFLSSGKYFLINNGPYYSNYDINIPDTQWCNIFVHGGSARPRICRSPLTFDKWIPSVLFLTHYLPDDPYESQLINIASLILGQNGIWGDLLKISDQGIELFNRVLNMYKQVRDDITESFPVRYGTNGGSPEIHEKINSATGKGAVVIFSSKEGNFTYITSNKVNNRIWCSDDNILVSIDKNGRAKIDINFKKEGAEGAGIIFFGVDAS